MAMNLKPLADGLGHRLHQRQLEGSQDHPVTVPQVLATIYHARGIDPPRTFPSGSGRPRYILGNRQPISELI